MEEKSEQVAKENSTMESEKMECDEALSASDSAEITTESNETHGQEKHEASQMQSETSGIEIASGSTSASEMPGDGTESLNATENAKNALVGKEQTETEMVTSASELPCEEMVDLDENERTEPSSIESEPPAQLSRSQTSAAEIQSEESSTADVVLSPLPQSPSNLVSEVSRSGVSSKQVSNIKEKATSIEQSPKSKGIIGMIVDFVSPTKKSKKSRSKSMSPSEKNKFITEEESNSAPETHTASEREGPTKENMGIMKTLKKSFSKFSVFKGKSSQTENESLVAGEGKVTEEQSASETDVAIEIKQPTTNVPKWTANRTSLTEVQSLGGTTMTDVPSTSSSSEVFSAGSSRKQSAAGESSEAVQGSYSEPTSNVTNSIENESQINVPTDEQTRQEAENADQQEPASNKSAQNKENEDETEK